MLSREDIQRFMAAAIDEVRKIRRIPIKCMCQARKALENGEVAVGCIIVDKTDCSIVARAGNSTNQKHNVCYTCNQSFCNSQRGTASSAPLRRFSRWSPMEGSVATPRIRCTNLCRVMLFLSHASLV